MMRAFSSELVKLRRPGLLLGGIGALLGFTILSTVLGIERATNALPQGEHRGFRTTLLLLATPQGLVHGITSAAPLLGIVVLAIFAAAFGSEYTTGALRNLLIREPRRARLLAGKYLAMAVFAAAVVTLACAVSVGITFALAPSKGIPTDLWTSSAGMHTLWSALWHVVLGSLGYGTLGAVLALVFRSAAVALGVGVAWMLPAEAILSSAWGGGDRWLPGRLLDALSQGGGDAASLTRAGVLSLIYAMAAALIGVALFSRRDVSG